MTTKKELKADLDNVVDLNVKLLADKFALRSERDTARAQRMDDLQSLDAALRVCDEAIRERDEADEALGIACAQRDELVNLLEGLSTDTLDLAEALNDLLAPYRAARRDTKESTPDTRTRWIDVTEHVKAAQTDPATRAVFAEPESVLEYLQDPDDYANGFVDADEISWRGVPEVVIDTGVAFDVPSDFRQQLADALGIDVEMVKVA